jgi:putative ABC transport system substrate-binding protein
LVLNFKAATATIPIVGTMGDPVVYGIVPSLARPGGNITGASVDAGLEISGKRIELLREAIPRVSRVGFLATRWMWDQPYGSAIQEAAKRISISLLGPPLDAPYQEGEYRRVLAAMAQEGVDALIVTHQPENFTNRRLIVELAAEGKLPAMYGNRDFVEIGGLMAYGFDPADLGRRAADQIDQVLRGTQPAEIPIYQPTKFELSINLNTAKTLGIEVPPSLLARADEVIE